MKRFLIYAIRWQLGGIILAPILWVFLEYYKVPYISSMIILQLIGACIFYPIDMWISRQKEDKNPPIDKYINHHDRFGGPY